MLGTDGFSMNPTAGSHNVGGAIAITATANTDFHFASWTGTGSITFADANAASTTATVNGAGSITANFAANTVNYNIVVTNPAGSHGTIAPSGTTSYAAGATPSFTITADSGYHIASVTTNAGAQALTSPYVFPALAADGTLTATFAANIVSYNIVVTQTTNGAIDPSGTTSYAAGATPSFTITPAANYHIATIVTNAGSQTVTTPSGQAYVFPALAADGTLTATFAANTVVATKLVFAAGSSQTLTAGVISPTAIIVQRQDASNNPVSTGTAQITVTLSTGSSGGVFYSTAGGTTAITSITIAAGSSSSAGFYYKDTVAAAPTLTGASSGLTSATSQFTINAAAASKLVFTVHPGTVQHNVVSTVFTVQRQDQYGNPTTTGTATVTLASDGGSRGHFYSDSAGHNEITSTITIAAGSNAYNFYYQDTTSSPPQTRTITATSSSLTTASTTISVIT